jgi:hypothetical protein
MRPPAFWAEASPRKGTALFEGFKLEEAAVPDGAATPAGLLVVVFGRSAGDEDPAEADVALLLRGATLLDEAFLLAGLLAETDEALLLAGTDGTLLAETDEALLPAGADELGKTVITEVITVGTQLEMVWIEITGVEGLLVLEGG